MALILLGEGNMQAPIKRAWWRLPVVRQSKRCHAGDAAPARRRRPGATESGARMGPQAAAREWQERERRLLLRRGAEFRARGERTRTECGGRLYGQAPVLGLYADAMLDARIGATLAPTEAKDEGARQAPTSRTSSLAPRMDSSARSRRTTVKISKRRRRRGR